MSAELDKVNATLAQVLANQDKQGQVVGELVSLVQSLRTDGGGASDSDLAEIEQKLLDLQGKQSATLAAVPPEDLPQAPPPVE